MLGDGGAHLVLERLVLEVPGDAFVEVLDDDRRAGLRKLLARLRRLVDRQRVPILRLEPLGRDGHLERVVAVTGSHQRVLAHLEDRALHADAVHADGLGVGVAVVVGLAAHLERVVDGDVARDTAAVVLDGELVLGRLDLHEVLGVVDLIAVREAHRTVEAVVEEVEDGVVEADVARQHRHEELLGRTRLRLVCAEFGHVRLIVEAIVELGEADGFSAINNSRCA